MLAHGVSRGTAEIEGKQPPKGATHIDDGNIAELVPWSAGDVSPLAGLEGRFSRNPWLTPWAIMLRPWRGSRFEQSAQVE
jgi:hypothetical protein